MKISLKWLGDFVPGPHDANQISHALTFAGFPIESIETQGDDIVLDVEVTSNRGDCLSHVGIAREISAILGKPFSVTEPRPQSGGAATADAIAVDVRDPQLCPTYTARVIRGVEIGPSPGWIRERIEAVGLRPVNNVVDVTNYVLFELGQPLHAFDLDRLGGGRIVVRVAEKDETLVTLDGRKHALTPDMLVIADASMPVALAGVMGGASSEVTDRTTNVLIEAARFEPLSVRRTARRLAMRTDSSTRFERGIAHDLPDRASQRAAELILQTAGGTLLEGSVAVSTPPEPQRRIVLRMARLKQVLGMEISSDAVQSQLAKVGLSPVPVSGGFEVAVPPHRLDVSQEIDLIEEVVRLIGYDHVPMKQTIEVVVRPRDARLTAMLQLREGVLAAGYFEAVTLGFVSDSLAETFIPPDAKGLPRADPAVKSADARLRPSLLPGLLESIRRNETVGVAGARLFEIGSTFYAGADGLIVERRMIALAGGEDFRQMLGGICEALSRLDRGRKLTVVPAESPGYATGGCGRVEWGGEAIGSIGLVSQGVRNRLGLRNPVCIAELLLEPLLASDDRVRQLHPLPRLMPAVRDLSLVVLESTRFDQVKTSVMSLEDPTLEAVDFVTTYRGKPLAAGTKSMTINLCYRSPSGTLTGEQVDASVKRVIEALSRDVGATIRG